MPPRTTIRHALSVDLEEWFQVRNLQGVISRDSWPLREPRAEQSTLRLLDLFSRHGAKATFFVLGWVAERSPELIREIARRGHEIGVHGYGHQSVTELSPEAFEEDLTKALEILEPLGTEPIRGYRAPSFSLQGRLAEHFAILRRHGICYDSSYFPGRRSNGVSEKRPSSIHPTEHGLIEVPLTSLSLGGLSLPCGGGGFFRLLPYPVTRTLFRIHQNRGFPVIFYIHPWEIDPEQPRVPLPPLKAFKHGLNLSRTFRRLERLLQDFSFSSIREVLDEHGF